MRMGKKIALDTYYFSDTEAKTVGVVFENWGDSEPKEILEAWTYKFGPYIPGEFYKRELPCMMDLLMKIPDLKDYDAIIIDGLAHLPKSTDGLGMRLEAALEEKGIIDRSTQYGIDHVGIIGVAKSRFSEADEDTGISKVYRGGAKTPLYVDTTWFGYSSNSAGECIKSMHGLHRIPTLLKLVDTITRTR
jgi:exodeoxyribonuclease-5/deoxyribonuclease V